MKYDRSIPVISHTVFWMYIHISSKFSQNLLNFLKYQKKITKIANMKHKQGSEWENKRQRHLVGSDIKIPLPSVNFASQRDLKHTVLR